MAFHDCAWTPLSWRPIKRLDQSLRAAGTTRRILGAIGVAILIDVAGARVARAGTEQWSAVFATLRIETCFEPVAMGNAVPLIAVSPHDPALVLTCGLGRSDRGGAGWRPDMDPLTSPSFSRNDPALAYAVEPESLRLIRSSDRAATWQPVEAFDRASAVWTADDGRVYVIGDGRGGPGLHVGSDAGGDWRDISPQIDWGGEVKRASLNSLAVGTGEEPVLYASTGGDDKDLGIFRSRDDGATWRQLSGYVWNTGAFIEGPTDVLQLALHPDSDERLYAIQRSGPDDLWLTDDGGDHWTRRGIPFIALAIFPLPWSEHRLLASARNGIWYSESEGRDWLQAEGVDGPVYGLAADPSDPRRIFALGDTGLWRSMDGGRSWVAAFDARLRVMPTREEPLRILWRASDPRVVDALLPLDDEHLAVHRSEDGGWTWHALPSPVTTEGWLAGPPDVVQTLVLIDPARSGYWLSEDGGDQWERIDEPCQLSELHFGSRASGLVYALCEHDAISQVYSSQDGGRSWLAAGLGLPPAAEENPGLLAVAPTDPSRLYVGYEDVDGLALFTSSNAARRWEPAAGRGSPKAGWPWALAVSPIDPKQLILLGSDGVFESRNAGDDWTMLAPLPDEEGSDVFVQRWLLDFVQDDPNSLLALGPGLQRSSDGGRTWTSLLSSDPTDDSALSWLRVTAAAADPGGSGTILAMDDGALGAAIYHYQWQAAANRLRTYLPAGAALGLPTDREPTPVFAAATTSQSGWVELALRDDAPTDEAGELLPVAVQIELPEAAPHEPSVVVLQLDDTVLATLDSVATLGVRWSGERVADCLAGVGAALPAPCVFERRALAGSSQIKLRVTGSGTLRLDHLGPVSSSHRIFLPTVGG